MSMKILILEPSVTMQSIFRKCTRKTGFDLSFSTNGIRILVMLYNSLPDAILVNARNLNPSCVDLCRLIKSVGRFNNIPIGVYATSDFLFSDEFKYDCGADMFISFDTEKILTDLEELCNKRGTHLAFPEKNDILKASITEKILLMIAQLESLPDIASSYLSLLAEICELPAASFFMSTDDEVLGYYICSKNFTEKQRNDFLKVCMTDFGEAFPNLNVTNSLHCNMQRVNM